MQQDIHSEQQEVQPVPLTRLEANLQILDILRKYAMKYPDMRFGQILFNLNIATHRIDSEEILPLPKDIFFFESVDTLTLIKEQFN